MTVVRQYKRITRDTEPLGAGNQFGFLSAHGASFLNVERKRVFISSSPITSTPLEAR
jgi:hypothetical protein